MSIVLINGDIRSYVIMLAIIALAVSVISVVINAFYLKSKTDVAISIINEIVCITNLAVLHEINRSIHYDVIENLAVVSKALSGLPFYIFMIVAILSVVFAIVQIYSVYVYQKTNISPASIKEGLENMKSGVTFYAKNGSLILTNKVMFDIYFELTGKDLQDGLELEWDLKTIKNRVKTAEKGGNLCFELLSGRVWQFSKTTVPIFKTECVKVEADDITEVFKLNQSVENLNSCLENEKKRLNDNLLEIEKVIAEEEILKVKMSVHDDFGKLIALTSRMYESDDIDVKREDIALQWSTLADKMQQILTFDKKEELSMESIDEFAKQLKCNLIIKGNLEENKSTSPVVLHGIFEFLKNAVYHENATQINVEIAKNGDELLVKCCNKNSKGISHIIEGGGLSNLRREVENLNGEMEVLCGDNIQLIMKFPSDIKEEQNA